jgi:hypothetical protein
MRELTKIVEMISSEMKSGEIAKNYLEDLEIDGLYKVHLERSFKKLVENYREQKADEMCRVFIIHIETMLNYHIGENLEIYKKLTFKYQGQNLARGLNIYNLNTLHLRLPKTGPINYIDHSKLSFKTKYLHFVIFNFSESKGLITDIFDCYKVRNYVSHGYLNPELSKRQERNIEKKIDEILSKDINDRFIEILQVLEFFNHAINKKNQLKELLEVDSKDIINNKNLLINILEKSNKEFIRKFDKDYKKLIKKEFNKQQKKEKMDKSIGEILKYSANKNSDKQIDLKDIGEDILEEINLHSGFIDPNDIGEDTLEEINLYSGMIDVKDIGNDILKEIDLYSGVINSKEIDNILNIINSNSDKIEPDDLIDILYEIEKRNDLND